MAHSTLSWPHLELLGILARDRLKGWMHAVASARCGGVEGSQRLFMSLGLTRPPTLAELLAKRFIVPELKALLRERHQPLDGRKADLAQRLAIAGDQSTRSLVSDVELTCLTQEGKLALAAFEDARSKADTLMQAAAFDSLMRGDLPHAATLVHDFSGLGLFPASAFFVTLGAQQSMIPMTTPLRQIRRSHC